MCEILALKLQAVLRNLTGQMKLSMGNRNKPLDYGFVFFWHNLRIASQQTLSLYGSELFALSRDVLKNTEH